jgi:uncharacterized membrane protein YadS
MFVFVNSRKEFRSQNIKEYPLNPWYILLYILVKGTQTLNCIESIHKEQQKF